MRVATLIATKDDRYDPAASWETLASGSDVKGIKDKMRELQAAGGNGFKAALVLSTSGTLKRATWRKDAPAKPSKKAAAQKDDA